ncbi:flavin reductase family protein [Agromyces sp. ZXT2-6]|uniref:flavin reductase family protein n=1 Tax=Agromyces sp. ZXT2-6 TaxID=3461153 RepID=UPI004054D213
MSELDLELSPTHPVMDSARPAHTGAGTEEARRFRALMREIAQPVAVLTGRDERGAPWGLTVTSFTSVSMAPPSIVVCLGSRSRTWSRIRPTGRFVLNVLGPAQRAVAESFAAPGAPFPGVPHRYTIDGIPVLAGTVAAVRCATSSVLPGGDHDVVLARVTRVRLDGGLPLTYRDGEYVAAEPIEVP